MPVRTRSLARTMAIACWACAWLAGPAAAARFGLVTLSNDQDTVSDTRVRVAGGVAVWQSGSGAFSEVLLWDGAEVRNLSSNGVADENPETDGIHVAWQQGAAGQRDIAIYDLLTDRASLIVSTGDETLPILSGVTIAWVELVDADGEVFIDPGPLGNQLTGNTLVESALELDGENLVFVQGDDLDLTPGNAADDLHDVAFWNGSLGEFYILGQPGNDDLNPSIAGDTIVWQVGETGSGGIWISDTSPSQGVLFPGTDDRNPDTDGRRVVWDHFDGSDRDIYMVDLASPAVVAFVTTDNAADDVDPEIDGDDIVWVREAVPGDSEIWVSWNGEPAEPIIQTRNNGKDDVRPQLDDGLLVFERCANLGQPNELCDVVYAPEPRATFVAGAALAVLAGLATRCAARARSIAEAVARR